MLSNVPRGTVSPSPPPHRPDPSARRVEVPAHRPKKVSVELLLIVFMLILAVLASNLISKLLPRVATPLVQILFGMVLSLVIPVPRDFELPSELFMMLFVAPLVYAESRGIDKLVAWRNRRTILLLAIGLVVVMTFVVGSVMGAAVSALPFAAAFVLGAALSPTDAVAVPALAEFTSVSPRQHAILSSESIVNDATGVVVFNLALAALVTGSFSPVEAAGSFFVLFFGGIVFGLAAGVGLSLLSSFVRKLGCDDVTFHALLDIAVPFITFLAAETIGVSSIMAVMVCALAFHLGAGKVGPDEARMNIVSNAVWDILTFALNGIVFVMLGYELRAALADIALIGVSGVDLALYAALLIVLVMGARFVYLCLLEASTKRRALRLAAEHPGAIEEWATLANGAGEGDDAQTARLERSSVVRGAAVLTFAGGTKGAVTMSIALSIPYAVQARSLIIFLISVVIIASVVAANVFVPLLAPAPKRSRGQAAKAERRARIEILRHVVERLSKDATRKTRKATQLVIADYNLRIRQLRGGLLDASEATRRTVRLRALELETECCARLMDEGAVREDVGFRYVARIERMMEALDHHTHLKWMAVHGVRRVRGLGRAAACLVRERLGELVAIDEAKHDVSLRELQLACARHVLNELASEMREERYPVEDVTHVLMDYQHVVELLSVQNPSLTTLARRANLKEQIQLKGVGYELEAIQDALDAGSISRETARIMRDGAYLMRLDLENLL